MSDNAWDLVVDKTDASQVMTEVDMRNLERMFHNIRQQSAHDATTASSTATAGKGGPKAQKIKCEQCSARQARDKAVQCEICEVAWYCCELCRYMHENVHKEVCVPVEGLQTFLTTALSIATGLSDEDINMGEEEANEADRKFAMDMCASSAGASSLPDIQINFDETSTLGGFGNGKVKAKAKDKAAPKEPAVDEKKEEPVDPLLDIKPSLLSQSSSSLLLCHCMDSEMRRHDSATQYIRCTQCGKLCDGWCISAQACAHCMAFVQTLYTDNPVEVAASAECRYCIEQQAVGGSAAAADAASKIAPPPVFYWCSAQCRADTYLKHPLTADVDRVGAFSEGKFDEEVDEKGEDVGTGSGVFFLDHIKAPIDHPYTKMLHKLGPMKCTGCTEASVLTKYCSKCGLWPTCGKPMCPSLISAQHAKYCEDAIISRKNSAQLEKALLLQRAGRSESGDGDFDLY
jgi:hypothetical protein